MFSLENPSMHKHNETRDWEMSMEANRSKVDVMSVENVVNEVRDTNRTIDHTMGPSEPQKVNSKAEDSLTGALKKAVTKNLKK